MGNTGNGVLEINDHGKLIYIHVHSGSWGLNGEVVAVMRKKARAVQEDGYWCGRLINSMSNCIREPRPNIDDIPGLVTTR